MKLTEEQEEEFKKASAEVKRHYDQIINERKNLFFMARCTKPCPNSKCNFTIQKFDGCNKMICTLCQTKFCWSCNAVLDKMANPYDHFVNNEKCILFGHVAVNSELTETELAGLEDDAKFKEMLKQSEVERLDPLDLFMCPTCCCHYIRERSKVNVINCIVCRKKLCFMCKKNLGPIDASE